MTVVDTTVTPGAALEFAVPNGREEEWRFTPLARLHGLHDGTFTPADDGGVRVTLTGEATLERVSTADPRVGLTWTAVDRVAQEAFRSTPAATVLTVSGTLTEPVRLLIEGTGTPEQVSAGTVGASFGHTVIEVSPGSTATVILDHLGAATRAANVECRVGDGAALTLVSVQEWVPGSVHLSHQSLHIGRDAKIRHVVVSLGGDVVRIRPTVTYAGPGGDAELLGVFFAGAGQHLEHRLHVEHAAPNCRSNVIYKGALAGADAHTVWVGDVAIRPTAVGTSTYELNRNLVLTPGARADSVPNLEIETGEVVGAGHASATGRFDDEQLFYLQSRGIPADLARRLVVRGFLADVVSRIGVAEIEDRVMAAVDVRLEEQA